MGLIKAILFLIVSIILSNLVFKNKKYFKKYPFANTFYIFFNDKKCYLIIFIMTLLIAIF